MYGFFLRASWLCIGCFMHVFVWPMLNETRNILPSCDRDYESYGMIHIDRHQALQLCHLHANVLNVEGQLEPRETDALCAYFRE
jgi:hypothetical protein